MTQAVSHSMMTFKVASLISLLFYTSTGWPTHTVCKSNHLEVYYTSCDPLQDFAFTLDSCSGLTSESVTIRAATVLRYSIKELFVTVSLTMTSKSMPVFSKQLCERDHPNLSFCGKKKGEHIYYEGAIATNIHTIPQGDFNVTVELFNEDWRTVACTNFTIMSH
ncbi:lymphocyte antigen 86 [Sphaerodactylus townsendi]|uniref:lymphocyte antigen 86 n=1 Tax=Sphaerodactylus townsendi TaxID=933632 RepID=UPI0020266DEF|nr:lymphocyte antigen 86 [Sphaerodactylus townsendi]